MVPNATRVTIHLVVCLSGTAVTLSHSSGLVKNELGNPQVTAKTRIHLTYVAFIEPCFGIGHNLSLICQMTSEDIKHQLIIVIRILHCYFIVYYYTGSSSVN